jgi:hypothetical protein
VREKGEDKSTDYFIGEVTEQNMREWERHKSRI